jgi:hypothetical protein
MRAEGAVPRISPQPGVHRRGAPIDAEPRRSLVSRLVIEEFFSVVTPTATAWFAATLAIALSPFSLSDAALPGSLPDRAARGVLALRDLTGHVRSRGTSPRALTAGEGSRTGCVAMLDWPAIWGHLEPFVKGGIGGLTLTTIALAACRRLLSERIAAGINAKYERNLELLRDELQRQTQAKLEEIKTVNAAMLAAQGAAASAHGSAQVRTHERRLLAVERVWAEFVRLRTNAPGFLSIIDMFPDAGLGNRLSNADLLRAAITPADPMETMLQLRNQAIDGERPFVGDYLFSLFAAYRNTLVFLTAHFLANGRTGKLTPWFTEVKALVVAVLGEEELERIGSLPVLRMDALKTALEGKFLHVATRLISGEQSVTDSLDQARRIITEAEQLRARGVDEAVANLRG